MDTGIQLKLLYWWSGGLVLKSENLPKTLLHGQSWWFSSKIAFNNHIRNIRNDSLLKDFFMCINQQTIQAETKTSNQNRQCKTNNNKNNSNNDNNNNNDNNYNSYNGYDK